MIKKDVADSMQAQTHASEVETLEAIINEIYTACGAGTTTPRKGNWNGAQPVIERLEELQASIEHTHQWYATRWEKLRALIEEHGSEALIGQAHCVMANGVRDTMDPPTYAQILNSTIHRLDALVRENRQLRARLVSAEAFGAA